VEKNGAGPGPAHADGGGRVNFLGPVEGGGGQGPVAVLPREGSGTGKRRGYPPGGGPAAGPGGAPHGAGGLSGSNPGGGGPGYAKKTPLGAKICGKKRKKKKQKKTSFFFPKNLERENRGFRGRGGGGRNPGPNGGGGGGGAFFLLPRGGGAASGPGDTPTHPFRGGVPPPWRAKAGGLAKKIDQKGGGKLGRGGGGKTIWGAGKKTNSIFCPCPFRPMGGGGEGRGRRAKSGLGLSWEKKQKRPGKGAAGTDFPFVRKGVFRGKNPGAGWGADRPVFMFLGQSGSGGGLKKPQGGRGLSGETVQSIFSGICREGGRGFFRDTSGPIFILGKLGWGPLGRGTFQHFFWPGELGGPTA